MREIKFRAWDDYNKEMINPYCELKDNRFWAEDLTNTHYITPIAVMQYTGLKDKNGKEIYEGDIVTYDRGVGNWTGKRMSTTHTIVFSKEVFAFVIDYGSSYIKLRKHWNYIYEIIGNIYENKNLLHLLQ